MKSFSLLIKIIVVFLSCQVAFGKDSKLPEMSLFHLDSQWKSDEGKSYKLKDFKGKLSVVAMVYTTCQHTCPMITSKILDIKRKLPKGSESKVRYSLISFDPERDTPEALREYKKKRSMGNEWVLLTGNDSGIRDLAAVLGVNYKKEDNGAFSHSNIITLVDGNGVVVEQITDLQQKNDDMIKKIKTLLK